MPICCKVKAQEIPDSVTVSRDLLESMYAKLSVCKFQDSILTSIQNQFLLFSQNMIIKDSLIKLQESQINLALLTVSTFEQDLSSGRKWYNTPYFGFIVGAGMVYLSSEILQNLDR